ncbi:unnamed protein product [Amoebophrya sp. A120]|nr:unnamed protein product [Amoebophrya sp. A120]|eukprot:GSA120T00009250001.1
MAASKTVSPLWGTDAWVDMWSGFRYPLQEPGTLPSKVQKVFSENQKLDFPLITEICELAEKRPYEILESVQILSQSLRENAATKLKVVTLLNEMVYSMHVVYCVYNDRNLLQMIRQLQKKGSEKDNSFENQLDEEMANNLRMFCCEIERKVRQESRNAVAPPKVKPRHIDISFSSRNNTNKSPALVVPGHQINQGSATTAAANDHQHFGQHQSQQQPVQFQQVAPANYMQHQQQVVPQPQQQSSGPPAAHPSDQVAGVVDNSPSSRTPSFRASERSAQQFEPVPRVPSHNTTSPANDRKRPPPIDTRNGDGIISNGGATAAGNYQPSNDVLPPPPDGYLPQPDAGFLPQPDGVLLPPPQDGTNNAGALPLPQPDAAGSFSLPPPDALPDPTNVLSSSKNSNTTFVPLVADTSFSLDPTQLSASTDYTTKGVRDGPPPQPAYGDNVGIATSASEQSSHYQQPPTFQQREAPQIDPYQQQQQQQMPQQFDPSQPSSSQMGTNMQQLPAQSQQMAAPSEPPPAFLKAFEVSEGQGNGGDMLKNKSPTSQKGAALSDLF